MGHRTTYVTSITLALLWLTLIACAVSPPPPIPPFTVTHAVLLTPYPAPPSPTAVGDMIVGAHLVIKETRTENGILYLKPYSGTTGFIEIAINPDAGIVLVENGEERRGTLADIIPQSSIEAWGRDHMLLDEEDNYMGSLLLAESVIIREKGTAATPPPPPPMPGELGYPGPVGVPIFPAIPTATLGVLPTLTPCNTCGTRRFVGVVTGFTDDLPSEYDGTFQMVSAQEYGYWYISVSDRTTLARYDWTPIYPFHIEEGMMLEVIGTPNGDQIYAEYVIMLDPATNPTPVFDPARPVPSE